VGKAIKDSGIPRDQIFVTTKFWSGGGHGRSNAQDALKGSLALLMLGYVDLCVRRRRVLRRGVVALSSRVLLQLPPRVCYCNNMCSCNTVCYCNNMCCSNTVCYCNNMCSCNTVCYCNTLFMYLMHSPGKAGPGRADSWAGMQVHTQCLHTPPSQCLHTAFRL